MVYFLPFASWVVPRDLRNPPASSQEDDPNKDKRDKKDKKDKKPTSKAKSGRKIGSWIVAHDEKGIPYWTNDASEESTYRLLVQQTNHPAMPLKHVGDGKLPPWTLPLAVPAKKVKKGDGKKGGDSNSSSSSSSSSKGKDKHKKSKEGGRSGGGGGGDDDGIIRMGIWEELFDAVNGTKIWYNTVTQKKTSKDPFF